MRVRNLAWLAACLTATSLVGQVAPRSITHLDLDDCDDIAADSKSLYLACHSTHIPGVPPATPPNMDGYAAKVDRSSGKILYLVRLGGEHLDIADRVIVDRRGFAYLTGFTGSLDFPITPNALQKTYGGGDSDAFLAVIDPDGNITYSTYFGGEQADQGDAIAWGRSGETLIAGTSWSANLPYTQTSFGPRGNGDAFVARLKPGDSSIHGAVIVGGSGAEKLTGIASGGGKVVLTGYTQSSDFPTKNGLQANLRGPSDGFLAAMPDRLQSLVFSTFLGGANDDSNWGVTLDRQGNPVVAGITDSDDLSTTSDAPQRRRAGKSDVFLMKLNPSGSKLLFSTFYGGTGPDEAGYDGQDVVVSQNGAIYAVGLTKSSDLVVPGAFHSSYGGGEQDGFLAAFAPTGKLCFGSYAGGTARYALEGITFADNERVVYAVGVIIRPIEPNSPRPNANEEYGTFVIALETPKACR